MASDPDLSRLLLIRERDVGLFSMVLQVIQTLHALEDQKSSRVPVALFGRSSVYYRPEGHKGRRTVWEYYFEPLVTGVDETLLLTMLGDQPFDVLESERKQLERARGRIEFPDRVAMLPPFTARDRLNLDLLRDLVGNRDWAWTENFSPAVDGREPDDRNLTDAQGRELIRRFVRPRAYIRRHAEALYEARLAGHHMIGVHVRGTDGNSASARGFEIPIDRYFSEIERRLEERGRDACRVFLATDEGAFVSLFEEHFGPLLVYCDVVRKVDGDEIFGKGPTGQVVPGYIAQDGASAVQNGADAVLEYSLLTRSDLLVHNVSSISAAARYCVPESIHV